MADLFNQQISATYSGLLKTSSSGVLSASLSQISDGRGNTSPLYLSTDSIQFYGAYSFPSSDGSANQVLKTDGAGVLTWEDDANSGTVTSVALSVPTGLTVTGSPITTSGTITIGGTLGVANGGTGATTLTGILVGNGTSAISAVTDGTVGQVLSTNGSGTYSFIDAATGDVSISGTPSTNEVAIWTNSNTIKGDASFTMSSSTFQINNSTASSQSNLIISNNDTAINSIPANIIFNSNTLTSYKTLAQIYATKTDADIANASGKLNFSTTDAGVPSVKFIINSNGLSEFLGNVNAYNTSSLKLYSLGQEGDSNTEFLEIKKSSTNAIFNVNKVGTGSVRGLEFQTGGSPKLTISSTGAATFSGNIALGTTPASATAGALIRLPFDNAIRWRNSSNTADIGLYVGAGNLFKFDSGATFSGALNGTSAKFTSTCFVNSPANDTIITTSDATNITNGFNLLGSSSYWGIRTSSSGDIKLDVFGGGTPINALSITQSTGAATFSGNVGIGEDNPNWMLEVKKDSSSATAGTYPAIIVNNPNAAGYSAFYLFNGTTNVGGLEYNNSTNSLSLNSYEGNPISIPNGVVFNNNSVTGNKTSVTLDAYEEGTWTPTNQGTSNMTTAPSSFSGTYTRIGNRVTCDFKMSGLTAPYTGALIYIDLGGFPFPQNPTTSISNGTCINYPNGRQTGGVRDGGSAYADVFQVFWQNTASTQSNATVIGTITYQV